MSSGWRRLVWLVPLGFLALTFALAWHFDRDFWRPASSLMHLAQEAAQRQDYPRSLELARKAVSRDPQNSGYRLALAQIYLDAGKPQASLDLSRRLTPQGAETSQVLALQARALERLGDRRAALKLLAGALKDNPDNAEILGLAAALAAKEDDDQPLAVTYYQRLYAVTRDPLARRRLADLLTSLNRFEEAIPLQEEEAAQYPENPEALHRLALLHYWRRDYQAAGRIYQQLLEKTASDAALRLEAARNAEAGHQTDQALAHYLWLYSRNQGKKEYAVALAKLWSQKGNHAEAAGILAPLMQDNPDPELRRRYALELLLIGDMGQALKTYQAAWAAGDTHQETIIN
ncbi:MAG TPA: tetratricopeptide repeat protein, partial [Desulfobaccales bacterium]